VPPCGDLGEKQFQKTVKSGLPFPLKQGIFIEIEQEEENEIQK
jgi:hypothetical protein